MVPQFLHTLLFLGTKFKYTKMNSRNNNSTTINNYNVILHKCQQTVKRQTHVARYLPRSEHMNYLLLASFVAIKKFETQMLNLKQYQKIKILIMFCFYYCTHCTVTVII